MSQRNWEKHFPDFDVPRLVDFLVDKGVLIDNSEDGDDGPNFNPRELPSTTLFVNHPLRSMRDVEDDRMRFVILRHDDAGDVDQKYDTDDLEEALIRVFETDDVAGWTVLEPLVEEHRDKANETRDDQPRV